MDTPPVALVVDDRANMLKLMAKVLGSTMVVRTASSGADAIAALRRERIDVVLCDLKMPDMSGLEVLRACKEWRPGAAFVVMTAYATVSTAVEALRLGHIAVRHQVVAFVDVIRGGGAALPRLWHFAR